jgi:hypothetical protein
VIKVSPLYSVEEIRQEFKLCFDVFCMTSKIENENELSEEEALTCVQFKGEYQNVAECCRMLLYRYKAHEYKNTGNQNCRSNSATMFCTCCHRT